MYGGIAHPNVLHWPDMDHGIQLGHAANLTSREAAVMGRMFPMVPSGMSHVPQYGIAREPQWSRPAELLRDTRSERE